MAIMEIASRNSVRPNTWPPNICMRFSCASPALRPSRNTVTRTVPTIRTAFDELEREFFAEAPGMKKASSTAKSEFVRDCWRRAEEATDRLIADLERRNYFLEHVAYKEMWDRFNREGNFALA